MNSFRRIFLCKDIAAALSQKMEPSVIDDINGALELLVGKPQALRFLAPHLRAACSPETGKETSMCYVQTAARCRPT